MLKTFKAFKADTNAWDMYITGQAGTGKTTDLATLVQYCMDEEIDYTVCAFTHKACGILRDKLPPGSNIRTLDSLLKRRPGINQHATNHKHVQTTISSGDGDKSSILFVDEYSMVGEKHLMDIRALQDEDYDGNPEMRVVWLGDPNQLPPVGDQQSIKPSGKYAITLTHIYRQAADNPLMTPLNQLVSFISGEPAVPLVTSHKFKRGKDIVAGYRACTDDKVMLAFTNKRVENLNAEVQGYGLPKPGDEVFSPTMRERFKFHDVVDTREVYGIELPFGDNLALNSKFKTLEYVLKSDTFKFVELIDEEGDVRVFCSIFGHYQYKMYTDQLMKQAAATNLAIEQANKGFKAAGWAKANPKHKLARARAKAWRDYLSFNECCICLDFAHAMTVHKSQGSTYHTVYLDSEDLGIAADINYLVYLKLMYVALSRASDSVITN